MHSCQLLVEPPTSTSKHLLVIVNLVVNGVPLLSSTLAVSPSSTVQITKKRVRACKHADLGYAVMQAAMSAAMAIIHTKGFADCDPGDALWPHFVCDVMAGYKHKAYTTDVENRKFEHVIDAVDAIWLGAACAAMGANNAQAFDDADCEEAFWKAMISAAMDMDDVKAYKANLQRPRELREGARWDGTISVATAASMLKAYATGQ